MQQSITLSDHSVLELTEKVVGHYIRKAVIPLREKEDVQMGMVEKFLSKKNKIAAAFKGNSNLNTYCYAVLNRMCLEIIKKESKYWAGMRENTGGNVPEKSENSLSLVIIEDEIALLEKILRMFDEEMPKVVLFLKFMYEIRIQEADILNYTRGCFHEEISALLDNKEEKLTGTQKFEILKQIVNLRENKCISPDAVRMYYNKILSRILNRLNGTLQHSAYNKESLGVLLDFMYDADPGSNAAFPGTSESAKSFKYA